MNPRSFSAAQVAIAHDDAHVEARLRVAMPPASVSPAVPIAPARGPVLGEPQFQTVMTSSGPRQRRMTEVGFEPARAEDAFDRMMAQSKRRSAGDPVFSVGQINAGRVYAALSERCASEGMRCASPEARRGGGGGAAGWIDRVILRREMLVMIHAHIGDGLAMARRGAMAHADRPGLPVTVRHLVDAVCLHDRTVSQILTAGMWQPNGRNIDRAREALCAALDRMSMATEFCLLDVD